MSVSGSDAAEGTVRLGREFDANGVAGVHSPSMLHDTHDPGLARQPAALSAADGDLEQARTEVVDLLARAAQARDADDRLLASGRRVSRGNASTSSPAVSTVSPRFPCESSY